MIHRPWSLLVVRPDIVRYLDTEAGLDDFVARLTAADEVEAAGFPREAERYRWLAGAGKRPRLMGIDWAIFVFDESIFDPTAGDELHARFFRDFIDDGLNVTHAGPSRQAVEDDAVEFMLPMPESPFLLPVPS